MFVKVDTWGIKKAGVSCKKANKPQTDKAHTARQSWQTKKMQGRRKTRTALTSNRFQSFQPPSSLCQTILRKKYVWKIHLWDDSKITSNQFCDRRNHTLKNNIQYRNLVCKSIFLSIPKRITRKTSVHFVAATFCTYTQPYTHSVRKNEVGIGSMNQCIQKQTWSPGILTRTNWHHVLSPSQADLTKAPTVFSTPR